MVTHKGSLLELCTLWAGEHHPPGHGGAHAQQVGGAGGGDVCIVIFIQIIVWNISSSALPCIICITFI